MRVAVLGAGLQGTCTALALAEAGVRVDLIDRRGSVMSGASLHNEGKVHLGYVYAHDTSRRTAEVMIQGALEFQPLLERWLGTDLPSGAVADPFDYVVHRDSLLSPAEVEAHFAWCADAAAGLSEMSSPARRPSYFGLDPTQVPRPQRVGGRYDERVVAAAYATHETALDPRSLAPLLTRRLIEESLIDLRCDATVESVEPERDGATVRCTDGSVERYDHVVNALWDGRIAIDRTAGLEPGRPWWYRVKYFVRLAPTHRLPSMTAVLGPFGDVVTYGDGGAFLSWYPVGRLGTSCEVTPPPWPDALHGPEAQAVLQGTVAGLADLVPGVAAIGPDELDGAVVRGGVIVAHGSSDIDDPGSVLHQRHAVGPRTHPRSERYHSVDTGKLTTAPRFARLVAERVVAIGAR